MPKSQKQPPGYDGRFEQSFKVVMDPYEAGAELTAAVNTRVDIIEMLYNRRRRDGRRCIDTAQYCAGNHFLGLLERAEHQGVTCDPTREPVDGSRGDYEFTARQALAWKELRKVAEEIGLSDYSMIYCIVGLGHPLHDGPSKTSSWRRNNTSQRFRRILTALAIMWGYQSSQPQPIDSRQRIA
jgi:hypothetical protein